MNQKIIEEMYQDSRRTFIEKQVRTALKKRIAPQTRMCVSGAADKDISCQTLKPEARGKVEHFFCIISQNWFDATEGEDDER